MRGSAAAPAGDREAVGPEAGAEDGATGGGRAARVARARAARRGAAPRDRGAEVDAAAGRLDVGGVARGDGDEVDDRRSPASAAPRRRGRAARSRRSRRRRGGAGRGRRSRGRAVRARRGRPQLALVERRRSACRSARSGMPALVAVGVELARALDAEARLQRARLVVDAGVDRRRWSGPVWWRPIASSGSSTQRRAPGRRASSSRATARPRMPPPTTTRSHSAGGFAAGLGVTAASSPPPPRCPASPLPAFAFAVACFGFGFGGGSVGGKGTFSRTALVDQAGVEAGGGGVRWIPSQSRSSLSAATEAQSISVVCGQSRAGFGEGVVGLVDPADRGVVVDQEELADVRRSPCWIASMSSP